MEILNTLLPYFLIALFGAVLHILKKLATEEENDVSFNVSAWFKRNRFRSILGLLLSFAAVFVLFEADQMNYTASFMAGFMGNSFTHKGVKSK